MALNRTHTYTYALLEVSEDAFNEIAEKLKAEGYGHAFNDYGRVIDMHGLALTMERDD